MPVLFHKLLLLFFVYNSAQVCAQAQVHSLFPHSHSAMGRRPDMAGEISDAGPTGLRAFQVFSKYVVSSPLLETDSNRIVNGYELDITQIPYQASLRRKVLSGWAHICGAVVVSTRGVLTAAHCAESHATQPSSLRVSVGTSFRLSGGKTYDLEEIIVHEDFSSVNLNADIAFLVTSKSISFSQAVNPIQIAPPNFELPVGTEALVSGFGTTSYLGSSSAVLLAARVNIISQEACSYAYLRLATIYAGMICAGASDPPRDACQGDSGGPLVAKNHLIGIVSWGEGCADTSYPGVYTRVSKYYAWIQERMY